MFPIFFKHEKVAGLFTYSENGVEYKMPLSLMLQFKSWLRRVTAIPTDNPVNFWVSNLDRKEFEQIVIA